MNYSKYIILLFCFLMIATCASEKYVFNRDVGNGPDLILIHGLTNKHPWGEKFLSKCLDIWGSGNIYTVYLNSSNSFSVRNINNKIIYVWWQDSHNTWGLRWK